MTGTSLYAVVGVALFFLSAHGLATARHLMRKVLAINMMGSGVCLVLVAIANRAPDAPPDPVPHALVLTGVVVAVSATAYGLALARRLHSETGSPTLPEDG